MIVSIDKQRAFDILFNYVPGINISENTSLKDLDTYLDYFLAAIIR